MVPSYTCVVCLAHCSGGDEDARPHLRELVPGALRCWRGKVLLAWRDRWRETVLARPLQGVTSRTVTDARALRQELDLVRREGYAAEELDSKVVCEYSMLSWHPINESFPR